MFKALQRTGFENTDQFIALTKVPLLKFCNVENFLIESCFPMVNRFSGFCPGDNC